VLRAIEAPAPAPAPADPPIEISRWVAHWNELGATLESGRFVIFMAAISILDATFEAIEARAAAMPGAPLTARRVLVPARYRGVTVFTGQRDPPTALHASAVLLATIGIDLADAQIRAQLLELNRRGEIRLAQVAPGILELARSDLVDRGEQPELIEESAIVDGDTTYHAVLLSSNPVGYDLDVHDDQGEQ
jgi:hypothetical protein